MGTLPAVMNAANDFMVQKFLNRECRFMDIYTTIKNVMKKHENIKHPTLTDIQHSISWATEEAKKTLGEKFAVNKLKL